MKRAAPLVVAALYLAIVAASVWAVLRLGALSGMSWWIFLEVDLPGTILLTAVVVAAACVAGIISERSAVRIADAPIALSRRAFAVAAALVVGAVAVAAIGAAKVHHGYAFSMDEWMTKLQAALFLDGRLSGEVPPDLRADARAFLHGFAAYDEATGAFASNYRPGTALIYALFDVAGLGVYASAVLNAGAVFFTFLAARRLWPDRPDAWVVAALLVATSQQALAAAMTAYSMSAHLFMAALWLWLFLRDRLGSHVCAALVGFVAASLHQIHVHAFFAAPFLLTLLHPLRMRLITIYGSIYLIGHGLVYAWDIISFSAAEVEAGAPARSVAERFLRHFAPPELADVATALTNLSRLFTWQNAALAPLLAAVVLKRFWSGWTPLLVASVVLSFAPYPFLAPEQGHGWGYRYLHVSIGVLALLGAAGWVAFSGSAHVRLRAFAVVALAATAVVGPIERAMRIEPFVRPYAEATERVMASGAEIVIIEDDTVSYGGDIARFDPVRFAPPTVLRRSRLSAEAIERFCANYDVQWFDRDALLGPDPQPRNGCPD